MPEDHSQEPQRNYVGKRCSFDYEGRRLAGVIVSQEYAGLTPRGAIPDHRLVVRGASGRTVTVSLVESYTSIHD
jgi:hypothetical protein